MAHDVKIPAVGESITEGTLSKWLVADGAIVGDSTPLFELETDKITTEVQSGAAGQVRFKVKEGETLAIGTVVASIDTAAAGAAPAKPAAPAAPAAKVGRRPRAGRRRQRSAQPGGEEAGRGQRAGRRARSPAAARTAASPRATCSSSSPSPPRAPAAPSAPTTAQPAAAAGAGTTRKKMSSLRQRIAQRLVQAQHTAAILTTFNEIDMGAVMDLRKKHKEEFEKKLGVGLGFMSFFGIAAIKALQKYPLINSQIEGTDIVGFDGIHLGVAVGTEKGLVVPVVRHAEKLSFAGIEKAIKEYALKARDGKLAIDDMQGGTFTITNGGVYGSLMSTPIINPPQSGILGLHAIKERPMAVNGQVVIRPMMYVALSYDHRIVDGAEAVGFLVRIKELIESPEKILLGL